MSEDYRKKYIEETGFDVPSNWHIHHIDHDRSNNQVSNLLALPDFVHQSFHFYKSFYPDSIFFKQAIYARVNTDSIKKMADMLECVKECAFLKDEIQRDCYMNSDDITNVYDSLYKECQQKMNR